MIIRQVLRQKYEVNLQNERNDSMKKMCQTILTIGYISKVIGIVSLSTLLFAFSIEFLFHGRDIRLNLLGGSVAFFLVGYSCLWVK